MTANAKVTHLYLACSVMPCKSSLVPGYHAHFRK